MAWTHDDINEMAELYNKGLRYSLIAKQMSGMRTKAMVAGKIDRLRKAGDVRFGEERHGGARERAACLTKKRWADAESLDLLLIKAIKRPAEKWEWPDIADYFETSITQVKNHFSDLERHYRASENA
ncbi:MAG: GcrA family cell cycle regulator [Pseudomonadota bacterium]